MDRGRESTHMSPLKIAQLMSRTHQEAKLLKAFEKKIRERTFRGSGLIERPAIKTATRLLNRTVGRVAGRVLEKRHKGRSQRIYQQIERHIEKNSTVLDVGCGNGKVGELIMLEKGSWVRLMDVEDYNKTLLKLQLHTGISIPYPDNSFDHVLLLTVLHHSDDPIIMMKEALRVADKNVIVIESVYFNELHKNANKLIDWFCNRVLNNPEVNVPFNFLTATAWVALFEKLGGNVTHMEHLGIDQPWAPEYHVLYVIEKK